MGESGGDDLEEALARLAEFPGDQEAWATIYRRTAPFILSITFRMMQDFSAAEDVAQETFLRVAHYYPFHRRFEPKIFKIYIAQIARNAALDARRKHARVPQTGLEEATERADPGPEPGAEAQVASTLAWLEQRLTAQEAELFRQLIAEVPRPLSEIADGLGVSYNAAGVRLHRLRRRIGKLLGIRVKS